MQSFSFRSKACTQGPGRDGGGARLVSAAAARPPAPAALLGWPRTLLRCHFAALARRLRRCSATPAALCASRPAKATRGQQRLVDQRDKPAAVPQGSPHHPYLHHVVHSGRGAVCEPQVVNVAGVAVAPLNAVRHVLQAGRCSMAAGGDAAIRAGRSQRRIADGGTGSGPTTVRRLQCCRWCRRCGTQLVAARVAPCAHLPQDHCALGL